MTQIDLTLNSGYTLTKIMTLIIKQNLLDDLKHNIMFVSGLDSSIINYIQHERERDRVLTG